MCTSHELIKFLDRVSSQLNINPMLISPINANPTSPLLNHVLKIAI